MVFSVDPGRGAIRGDHLKLPVVKNSFLDVSIVQILVHRRGLLGFWLISSPMRDNRERVCNEDKTSARSDFYTWLHHCCGREDLDNT